MTRRLMQKLPFDLPQHFKDKFRLNNIPKYYESQPEITLFEKQTQLPKLPIPELHKTLSKYLKSLKPLLTPNELNRTKRIVEEFKNDPFSKSLQKRLQERSDSSEKGWLAEYWNNYAYLEWRDACAGNVNFFYHFKDDFRSQVNRASALIREFIGFRQLIINHELSPEMIKDQPLCSHMYNFLFNTTRIPLKPRDQVSVSNARENHHVVVIYRHNIYVINTVVNNTLLSTNEIQQQIQQIILQEQDRPHGVGIGALTSWNRDKWSDVYQHLLKDPENKALFNKLQTAAFSVSLDEHSPVTLEECANTFLYGDVSNRWFDKSEQLIVCANGKAGLNNEHSMMDGTINTRLCDQVLQNMTAHDDGQPTNQLIPKPQKLRFKIDKHVLQQIELAKQDFKKWADPQHLSVLAYYGYGKSFIKELKCSPDAFVQMGLQLAHYKLYKKCVPTYESATIRKFKYSRTETCRTVSNESVAFCKAFEDPQVDDKTKANLLRNAIKSHGNYMGDAVNAHGVDRHLLGLKSCLKANEQVPALFLDDAYKRSCHWNISSSQLSSEYYSGYGWSAVVPDGFGFAYCLKDESIHVNLMSLLNTEHMRQKMVEAFEDLKHVMVKDVLKSKL